MRHPIRNPGTFWPRRARRAVTLVEVLVTIGVTVILTLILITGLRAVRGQTLAMKDLQNLRLSGQDMLLWSTDNDDVFLNIGTPGSPRWGVTGLPPGMDPVGIGNTYWGQQSSWNVFLSVFTQRAEQHWQSSYGLRTFSGVVGGTTQELPEAGTRAYAQYPSRFRYSPAFLTAPEMWVPDAYFENAGALVPYFADVRTAQVVHPASKAVLVNFEVVDHPERRHLAAVDGSAHARDASAMQPVAPYTLAPAGTPGIAGIHTLDGHRGRDL
jgi:hypothetical protein